MTLKMVGENTVVINKQKYRFLPYSAEYPSMFLKERNKITKSLGKNITIEHVGSTSIPGLGGKGIIDIAIKTPRKKINQYIRGLEKLGYRTDPEHLRDGRRIYLKKIVRYRGKESRVHIHLTLNDGYWNTYIVFREYLKKHSKELEKYAQIKKEAVNYAKGEGKKYREYKDKFLNNMMKKALKMKLD